MSPMNTGACGSTFGVLATAILALALLVSPVAAEKSDFEAEARRVLGELFEALRSGDPEKVRPFLAPEFQLVRANGAAYDKEQYLAGGIPQIDSKPVFNDLVVTRNGNIVVTRMRMQIEEKLQDQKAQSNAPQLIVFRMAPNGWQVVASGNFAKLED